jgi:hypothetical protein
VTLLVPQAGAEPPSRFLLRFVMRIRKGPVSKRLVGANFESGDGQC